MKAILMMFNGISFFNYIIDPTFEINFELVSGFMSAIDSFAHELYGSDIKAIDLGNNSILSLKVPLKKPDGKIDTFTMIGFITKGDITSQKNAQTQLEIIRDSFLKIYTPADILNWDGNILVFLPFKKAINGILNIGNVVEKTPIEPEKDKKEATFKEGLSILIGTMKGQVLESFVSNLDQSSINDIITQITKNLAFTSDHWEGIIPLLNRRQIVFIYAKKTKDARLLKRYNNEEDSFIAIAYFISDQYQMFFSKLIQILIQKMSQSLLILQNQYITEWDPVFNQIKEQLTNQLITSSPINKIMEDSKLDVNIVQFCELKDWDQLVSALVSGSPPVAISSPTAEKGKDFLDEMVIFTPHRSLRIMEYPEQILTRDQVDLVIIRPNEVKKYKDFVILDSEKKQIKNGTPNKFMENIRKEIIILKEMSIISQYIKRKINFLLSKANLIRDLSIKKNIQSKDIRAIRADLDPDAEKIVLKLAEGKNSALQNLVDFLIEHIPLKQLLLDKNFIQYSDRKIIINADITPDQIKEYHAKLLKMGTMFLGPRLMMDFV